VPHSCEPRAVTDAADDARTILVPLDGSAFSEVTVPVASRLAERLSADIVLFSAVPTADDVPERERELARSLPGRQVQRLVVVNLDVAGAIHEALRRLPGAVACMATRGRGRTAALIGSVATEVIARGHDPLILVGPLNGDYAPWLDDPEPSGVVAGVDENPAVDTILSAAVHWAKMLHERLLIVSIAEPLPPPLASGEVHRKYGPDGDVTLFLRVLATRAKREIEDVEVRALYDPVSVADGMRTFLREHPAQLVVVSTHGYLGIPRALFGSVAADIVRSSPSPVLVVPYATPRRPKRRRHFARRPRALR
jgi:nucleotide-binding universal stress UspA family protein